MLNITIPFDKIVKIKPVLAQKVNGKYESIQQVKNRVGCSHILNGGLYNMSTYALCSGLMIDGKLLFAGYHGFGSKDERTLEFNYNGNNGVKDYFAAYGDTIQNGIHKPVLNETAKRGRTGIGIKDDKSIKIVVIGDTESKYKCGTTDFMTKYFLDCKYAGNLDGGGSSQVITPNYKYLSGRNVAWYICIWVKEDKQLTKYIVTRKAGLYYRSGNGVGYKYLGTLPYNTQIEVESVTTNGWAKFIYQNQVAYCNASYLKKV